MTKKISSKDFENTYKQIKLQCECGWAGTPKLGDMNLYAEVMDYECPKCEKMLLIVNLCDQVEETDKRNPIFSLQEINENQEQIIDKKKPLSQRLKEMPYSIDRVGQGFSHPVKMQSVKKDDRSHEDKAQLKIISLEKRERVKESYEENTKVKDPRSEFVKNFKKRQTPNPKFTLKMSGNHSDDTQKLVHDLKSQFPDDYTNRLVGMIIDLRKERDLLLTMDELSLDETQDLTNLKYDVEIMIEAFKVFVNTAHMTEEIMFPVEGEAAPKDSHENFDR